MNRRNTLMEYIIKEKGIKEQRRGKVKVNKGLSKEIINLHKI